MAAMPAAGLAAGAQVPGAPHRVPLQCCQPCWPGSGAKAASFLSPCLMYYLPCLPAHLHRGQEKGEKTTHLREAHGENPPLPWGLLPGQRVSREQFCVFWAGFRGSGPGAPV